MSKTIVALAALGSLIATPILAADMAVKASPAPAPSVASWTGFYLGVDAGYGWTNNSVTLAPNDPASASILAGTGLGAPGEQPVVSSYNLRPSGAVGGIEAGYNWQVGRNWLWGIESDFSFSRLNGQAIGTSLFVNGTTQSANVLQDTDWYGTIRGRLGWLATPNLLIFGTGGFAYGRVGESANYVFNGIGIGGFAINPAGSFSVSCTVNVSCFLGNSNTIQTGWTAGGGAEWMFMPHVSLKAEYQIIDLGTQTVTTTAQIAPVAGTAPASFSAAFRDQIQVVRVGLNWHL
jgi:outer membrane immunogenic protein